MREVDNFSMHWVSGMARLVVKGGDEVEVPGRRRSAVCAVDIVGYSVLMGAAPETMYAAWMELLATTLQPLGKVHRCRVLKSTGDGVIAEFPSADTAMDWALGVQRAARERDRPDRLPIAFRIALDMGEVFAHSDDVYGECVNIAARLQEHAPPGGLALTEAARNALSASPPLHDIGRVRLRNIAAPVRASILVPDTPPRIPRRLPSTGRPAIAVLPFRNTEADWVDRYFTNGIIEDIILSLGALHDVSVIARGATLGWSDGQHDPCVVGRVLGVRYVLSGAVVRRGGGLQLSALLQSTEEGDTIWHDRFDVAEPELFAVQDEIVTRTVDGLVPNIRAAELRLALRKTPESLTAYDHMLRGIHALDGLSRDTFATAERHLKAAIREDPGYATPAAWAAQWHSLAIGQAWSDDPQRDVASIAQFAASAIQLDPRSALGHAISGHYRAYHKRDPESALPFLDRAVEIGPSHALAWALRSASLSYLGRGNEALASAQRGFSLSPLGADRYYYQFFVGLAQYVCGEHAAAARSMRLSLADSPCFTSAHRILVASLDAQGEHEAARALAIEMMRCEPNFRLNRYAAERQPFTDPGQRERLLMALRTAGVPE